MAQCVVQMNCGMKLHITSLPYQISCVVTVNEMFRSGEIRVFCDMVYCTNDKCAALDKLEFQWE